MPTGYVIWEGESQFTGAPIVAIATMESSNRKTGNMVQVWILPRDTHPVEALATGQDESVCGTCPHRGDGTGKGRVCYVEIGKAPSSVWRAYHRGAYPRVSVSEFARIVAGRRIRWGSYGDPGLLPLALIRTATRASDGATGYTHAWRTVHRNYQRYLMASCDSATDYRESRRKGWRAFVLTTGAAPDGAMLCASERNGRGCIDCMACGGTREGTVRGVSVYITAHGAGARHFAA